MTSMQAMIEQGHLFQAAREINAKVASDFMLLSESESFPVLINHLKALLDDFNEDEDVKTSIAQLAAGKLILKEKLYSDQKKSIQWMRKHLSRLRGSTSYLNQEVHRKVEEAYRYVSRTKEQVRNPETGEYFLVRKNGYWTCGFVLACWEKFREACRLIANRGEFSKLSGIAKCSVIREFFIVDNELGKKEKITPSVVYPFEDKLSKILPNQSNNFIKTQLLPTLSFDENLKTYFKRKIILQDGDILGFYIPEFLTSFLPQHEEELRKCFQTSLWCCITSLEELVETGIFTGADYKISEDPKDPGVLEDDSLAFWRSAARVGGEQLKEQDFWQFRADVLDLAGRLILFLSRETAIVRKLKGNSRVHYFKERAQKLANRAIRIYVEGHPKEQRQNIHYSDAILEAKDKIFSMQLPADIEGAFSDNLWKEEAKKVAKKIDWKPNGGRPKNQKKEKNKAKTIRTR